MNLLQINATYGIGSTGRIVKDIHELATENGICSYVACRTSIDEKDTYKIGNIFDYKIHALLCRVNGRQAYFSKRATRKLIKYMQQIKPDIIHLHNLHSNFINLNMFLDYVIEKDVALVLTLHDCWFYTGKCFHYTLQQCNKWKEECIACPKRWSDTPTYFKDYSQRTFRDRKDRFEKINKLYVVGASKWIANEAKQSILNNGKISYCHNGVDLTVFKPLGREMRGHLGIKDTDFVILGMAGKWCSQQNEKQMKAICNLIDHKTKLVLIGADTIKKIDERIIKVPAVKSATEMAQWYSMADVFVNLTWEDTLPFVNIEALACGIPVITHRTSGATETVDEQTGICIEPGSIEEVLNAIAIVRTKGQKFYEKKCVERAKALFDAKQAYGKYFEIYGEIRNGS